jgi:hypothetical protein
MPENPSKPLAKRKNGTHQRGPVALLAPPVEKYPVTAPPILISDFNPCSLAFFIPTGS